METYYYKILSLRYPHALLVYVYPTKAAPLYTKPLVCPPPHTHAAGLRRLLDLACYKWERLWCSCVCCGRDRQTDRRTDTQSSSLRRPPCSTSPKASHNIISTNNTLNVPHTQYMHVKIIIFLHELHGSFCNCYSFSFCAFFCACLFCCNFLFTAKVHKLRNNNKVSSLTTEQYYWVWFSLDTKRQLQVVPTTIIRLLCTFSSLIFLLLHFITNAGI